MQVQSVNNQNSISINFGIRPTLKVYKKHSELLNKVADRFDVLNQKLDKSVNKEIRKNTRYHIKESKEGLKFVQSGYGEHYIVFDKNFLNQPIKTIAQTLAKVAKIFSYDDTRVYETRKYIHTITKNKNLNIDESWTENCESFNTFTCDIWNAYEEHVTPALENLIKLDKDFTSVKSFSIDASNLPIAR